MDSFMVLLAVTLSALVVLGIFNTVRIWRERKPFVLLQPSPEYIKSVRYQRFLSVYAVTGFVWWSFALIYFPEWALRSSSSRLARALLYVPVAVGWLLFAVTVLTGLAIYFNGRPKLLIPRRFRAAASKGWFDESGGLM